MYHVDLEEVFFTKSWRWFADLVDGLLADPNTRIWRQLSDDDPSEVVNERVSDYGGFDRWEAEA